MNVLITGGAGFIGSHLADTLLQAGHTVTIIDDLSTGAMRNIAHLKGQKLFHYRIDTVLNRPHMAELVDCADVIFHLAAAVGVKRIVDDPVETLSLNLKGSELVLELAARKRKLVVLTSTSEVYGKSTLDFFNEESDLVLGPTTRSRWCYAASKIVDEFLAQAYWKQKGVPVIIVRLFNTIGPRQTGQYGMVVPRFIRQALSNQPITVYGDGTQRRSFTWVGDVAQALLTLSESTAAVGRTFNIGHTKEISMTGLAQLIREMTRSVSEIAYLPYEIAYAPGFEDMARRMPDLTNISSVIGYKPSRNLRGMLEAIITYEQAAPTAASVNHEVGTVPVSAVRSEAVGA
jgi:UDP-glucose 4-epimerase